MALVLGLACQASGALTTDNAGLGHAHENMQPYLGLTYTISRVGLFPPRNTPVPGGNGPGGIELGGGGEYLASIGMFAGNFAPRNWAEADGQILSIASNTALFSLLGTMYGGDGRQTFGLPDLRGRVPVHSGGNSAGPGLTRRMLSSRFGQHAVALATTQIPSHNHTFGTGRETLHSGGGQSHDNMQPSLALNYCIALTGVYPSRAIGLPDGGDADVSDTPFIGEVGIFAGNFAPRGWTYCNGQLLQIASNTALFSLLGTTYGGDGRQTFGLPDLRGRTVIGQGNGPGLTPQKLGQKGGGERVTLTTNQMSVHDHAMAVDPLESPTDTTGAGLAHPNMQPTQALNYIIALQGLFPSRNIPEPDGEASDADQDASDPLLGEVKMFAGSFAPRGWAFCDGQLMQISQNQSLFSILGTTYGGDGRTTFALPDLRGRVAIHEGQGAGLPNYNLGQRGGAETVPLTWTQLPVHSHGFPTLVWDGTDPEQWTSAHWDTGPVAPAGSENMVVNSGTTVVSTDMTALSALSLSIAQSAPGGTVHVERLGKLLVTNHVNVAVGGVLRVDGILTAGNADILGGTLTSSPHSIDIGIIHGPVRLADEGTLDVDLLGAAADTLISTGKVTLDPDAALTIAIYGGGNEFQAGTHTLIFAGAGMTGKFDTVTDLGAYVSAGPNGDGLVYNETGGTVTLTLDYDLNPGDGNLDGVTDVLDRIIWSSNNFSSGTTFQTGDYNDDGVTDVLDRIIWNNHNFTSAAPPPAGPDIVPIPEPATVTLLLLALAAAPLRRRRRSTRA